MTQPHIIINPGTGAMPKHTLADAEKNMAVFLEDLNENATFERAPQDPKLEADGWYSFNLYYQGDTIEIDMPGLPLEQVRYLDEDQQNIWDFTRLYVNGSSWVWKYALSIIEDE